MTAARLIRKDTVNGKTPCYHLLIDMHGAEWAAISATGLQEQINVKALYREEDKGTFSDDCAGSSTQAKRTGTHRSKPPTLAKVDRVPTPPVPSTSTDVHPGHSGQGSNNTPTTSNSLKGPSNPSLPFSSPTTPAPSAAPDTQTSSSSSSSSPSSFPSPCLSDLMIKSSDRPASAPAQEEKPCPSGPSLRSVPPGQGSKTTAVDPAVFGGYQQGAYVWWLKPNGDKRHCRVATEQQVLECVYGSSIVETVTAEHMLLFTGWYVELAKRSDVSESVV